MGSSKPDWIVVECPACQATLKAPSGSEWHRLQCPQCGCYVRIGSAPVDAEDELEVREAKLKVRRGLSVLPTVRSLDPEVATMRGHEREEWEVANAPPRQPSFAASLHTTFDDDRRLDTEAEIHKGRRVRRREEASPFWEIEPADHTLPRIRLAPFYSLTLAALVMVSLVLMFAWGVKILLRQGGGTLGEAISAAEQTAAELRRREEGAGSNPKLYPPLRESDYVEAIALMRQFLDARTIEEMLPLVREPERVEPLMRDFYRHRPLEPVRYRRLPEHGEIQTYKNFLIGSVETAKLERHSVAVQRVPRPMKADWETYVGYCEVPWEKLAELRPTSPTLMRVRLAPDDYYNYAFSDTGQWQCFRLTSLRDEYHIYGYVRRGTNLRTEVDRRGRFNRLAMLTVRIQFPKNAPSPNQAEIIELAADGWLHTGGKPIARIEPAPEERKVEPDAAKGAPAPPAEPAPEPEGPGN
jgi:hypothetical protein